MPIDPEHEGDAYFIREFSGKVLIAVIDGLGHGLMAKQAAQRAIEILKQIENCSPDEVLEKTHRALVNTVGAVIGFAVVDREKRILTCFGVGNIAISIKGTKESQVLLPKGILGYNYEKKSIKKIDLDPGDILIMHTDGIRSSYGSELLTANDPQKIAQNLTSSCRVLHDDALVLVAADMLAH